MKKYKYQIYCQICHYKKLVTDDDIKDLSISKSSDIQAGIPKQDPLTKKTETPKYKLGKSKVKCPNCGRVIFIAKYKDPNETNNPS